MPPGNAICHYLLLRLRRLALVGFVLCVFGTGSFAFQADSGPKEIGANIRTYWPRSRFTLRADSNLVEVGVVVRDNRGRAIGGLGKDDFEIEDAGRRQDITLFSVETSTPRPKTVPETLKTVANRAVESPRYQLRYVALLFDDYSMPFAHQFYVKEAAKRFVRGGLSQGDRVGLFTTSGKQIVPFTDDGAKLAAAIDGYNSFPHAPDGGICPKLTPYDAYVIANRIDFETLAVKSEERAVCSRGRSPLAGGRRPGQVGHWPFPGTDPVMMQAEAMWTQIRDTSMRALETVGRLVDYMAQLPGGRMVLLASSGFLVGTLEREQQDVINRALRAEVVINAIDAKGLYAEDPPEKSMGFNLGSLIRMVRACQ